MVHSHAAEPAEVTIRLRDASATKVRQTALSHAQLNAHNTFERPEEIVPRTFETSLSGASLRCTLAPASVNRFDITLG